MRDFLRGRGVRHVLLCGYASGMCVRATTCGYDNLAADLNVFLVGEATLATFPASRTPALATQVALCHAALHMMISQAGWIVREREDSAGGLSKEELGMTGKEPLTADLHRSVAREGLSVPGFYPDIEERVT